MCLNKWKKGREVKSLDEIFMTMAHCCFVATAARGRLINNTMKSQIPLNIVIQFSKDAAEGK